MRGYFGIGVLQFSKFKNAGNLFRTAHAFGASFVYTIAAEFSASKLASDTSRSSRAVPWYEYDSFDALSLPRGCALVGVELTDEAIDLPRFHHPLAAAYLMGPEKGSLTPEIIDRCDHVVRIPTGFSLNVATAGAILMYDRSLVHGGFGERATTSVGMPPPKQDHTHGGRFSRKGRKGAPRLEADDAIEKLGENDG
ncbi:MAG: RNA methyltransferase [Minwuia sp.]|nr:RNA methyltransferase [Minwuia sp.]